MKRSPFVYTFAAGANFEALGDPRFSAEVHLLCLIACVVLVGLAWDAVKGPRARL